MQLKWPICGPKLSLCCTIISIWGIVQLLLMGIFFFVQAGPLLHELKLDSDIPNDEKFLSNVKSAYEQRAYNCWIAAFLYIGLLVLAGSQFMTNQKRSSGTNISGAMASPFSGVTTEENGFNRQYGIQFNGEQNE